MMKLITKIIAVLCAVNSMAQEVKESDFFKDGIDEVSKTVNLVKDYNANGKDDKDDSAVLQSAIDDLTKLSNGGRIDIPKGKFYLEGIRLKNNVHIVINGKTTIVSTTGGTVFRFGYERSGEDALVEVKNVSIRGEKGKRYKIDLTNAKAVKEKSSFVNCRHVTNFMIADFNIVDNYTRISSITLNSSWYNDEYFLPKNGVIKNGDVIHAHVGYGLVQMQIGHNILYKDLSGQGGITLRMESGASAKTPDHINIDNVYARNISSREGSCAFIMGSHTKQNGYVNIDGVKSVSSNRAGGVGGGFVTKEEAAKGHKPGGFASNSVIRNVHAVYGTKATIKSKNIGRVPCEIRKLISRERMPDNNSFQSPSTGVISCKHPKIKIENVTAEGFPFDVVLINRNPKADRFDCPGLEKREKLSKEEKKAMKGKKERRKNK